MSDFDISEVGASLVAHSQEQEISGRGLVTSLFPYIYTASKRMSTRSISSFLQEQHGVKLSAVTIAKALREPEKHIEAILERFEPLARIVAGAQDAGIEDVLGDENFLRAIENSPPKVWSDSHDDIAEELADYRDAVEELNNQWFILPAELRARVLGSLDKEEEEHAE